MYLLVVGVVVGTTGVSDTSLDVLALVEALECLFDTPTEKKKCVRKRKLEMRREPSKRLCVTKKSVRNITYQKHPAAKVAVSVMVRGLRVDLRRGSMVGMVKRRKG